MDSVVVSRRHAVVENCLDKFGFGIRFENKKATENVYAFE